MEQIIASPPGKRVLPDSRKRAEQEVRNANNVMRYVASLLRGEPRHPITEDLIREIHRRTTEGIDYPNHEPGLYRNHAVNVGSYVPPRDPAEIRRLMTEFVRVFNEGPPQGWPPVIRAIAAHFYLISIHPFGDGNGRTARGLESFLLFQAGVNARGFYSLANYYYQQRPEYTAMLDHVRFNTDGNITPFIRFALVGLVEGQEEVHQQILAAVTVIAFRDYAREILSQDGKLGTKVGERLLLFLLELPGVAPVSVNQLRRGGHPLSELYHGVTDKTVSRDLNYLQDHKLITIKDGDIAANFDVMREFMP